MMDMQQRNQFKSAVLKLEADLFSTWQLCRDTNSIFYGTYIELALKQINEITADFQPDACGVEPLPQNLRGVFQKDRAALVRGLQASITRTRVTISGNTGK